MVSLAKMETKTCMQDREVLKKVSFVSMPIVASVIILEKYSRSQMIYLQKISWPVFQNYGSLQAKLDKALKDKVIALEDKLNILVQLRDAEQRVLDSDTFMNIIKVVFWHKILPKTLSNLVYNKVLSIRTILF